jgi:tetratricopeptide (TPR) repeat protein
VEFFQKSIRQDPTFARAYAGLARAYVGLGQEGFVLWTEAIKLGTTAAEKAIALDPEVAEGHAARADLAFMADEPSDVLNREVRKALELNPNLAQGHSTLCAMASTFGVVESAIAQGEDAYHLDPLNPEMIRRLGDAYFHSGRMEDAAALWKKTIELSPTSSYRGLFDYSILKGDLGQAETYLGELERVAPSSDYAYLCRGYLAAIRGNRAEAMKAIAKLNEVHQGSSRRVTSIGFIYYALGDLDQFFNCMNLAAKEHTIQMGRIRLSPLFAGARRDPRFLELLSMYYFPDPTKK